MPGLTAVARTDATYSGIRAQLTGPSRMVSSREAGMFLEGGPAPWKGRI